MVLQRLVEQHEALAPSLESVTTFRDTLRDIDASFRQLSHLQGSEENLDGIERRLWELAQLKRKLNRTLPQILDLQNEIDANLSFLDESGLEKNRLTRAEAQKKEELAVLCRELNTVRQETAAKLEKRIQSQLHELGFKNGRAHV